MHEIKPIGGYLDVDEHGLIVKKASLGLLQETWKPAIAVTAKAYQSHFGKSLIAVYIRGSAAKGEALDFVSDLDTIAVVDPPPERIDTSWKTAFNAEMAARFPFVDGVEILAITPAEAKDPRRGHRIMLKTQSVCVFGRDISDEIPPIRIGRDAAQHFPELASELAETIDFFERRSGAEDAERRKARCGWIMKRILRTGFELVMERERKYTRDLYPCFESFSHHYPQRHALARRPLELAINRTDDPETVLPLLQEWSAFMPGEIERIFVTAH
jgi:hypothetical protein